MRLLIPALGLLLLAGCVNPTCQKLQNAATTNANACGAMPPTEAALQQCDSGIGQCSPSDVTALDAFATCLSEINGCGQMSNDPNDPNDSPVAMCSQKVANISAACGSAITTAITDAGDSSS